MTAGQSSVASYVWRRKNGLDVPLNKAILALLSAIDHAAVKVAAE